MRVLILGGAGFLGSNLVRRFLREHGHDVAVVDSLEPRLKSTLDNLREVYDRIEFFRRSILDETFLHEVVQDRDVIFNCAAQTSHPLSLQDPLYDAEINCLGTLKVLEAVRLRNRKAVVVYPSSSTVVGKAVGETVDEDHRETPREIYSTNKGVAEKYHRIYHTVHGLKTVVLRFPNLYGPFGKGSPEFGFVNYFIHLAVQGEEIRIFGRGDQTRNVLYVDDAVDILCRAAMDERFYGKVLFAAHHQHLTVSEVATKIVEVFGRGTIVHVGWPEILERIDVGSVSISSARLAALTGWSPQYTFEEGLLRTRNILESRTLE